MNPKILLVIFTILLATFVQFYNKDNSEDISIEVKKEVSKELSKEQKEITKTLTSHTIIEKDNNRRTINTSETSSVTIGYSPTPNVSISHTGKGNLLTDNAVSLGNINRVNGNIEIVRTDNSEHIGAYDKSSNVMSSSSTGMNTEDVDVLLTTAKKEISDTLTNVVRNTKSKITKDIVAVKKDLNKYISIKTEESLKLSTEFTDKHLDMREKLILANMDTKNTLLKDMVRDKVVTINQTITNSKSDNALQLDHLKKQIKEGDKLLDTDINKVSSKLSANLTKTDTALASLDDKLVKSVNSTLKRVDNVLTALTKAEDNLTSAIDIVNNELQIRMNTIKINTENNISRVTDTLNTNLNNTAYNITRNIESNTTKLANKIQELNTYIDNKMQESMLVMNNLASREYVDSKLLDIYNSLNLLSSKEEVTALFNSVSLLMNDTVSKDELDIIITDVNTSIEQKTNRTLELFWYYGDTCPINSIALNGESIEYSSLASIFEDGISPNLSGRFIRNKTPSSFIGYLEEDSVSPKGLYISSTNVNAIGVSDTTGEEDGSEHHWVQGGYGTPDRGYFIEPSNVFSITSHETETKPMNVTLLLCMHE